MMRSRLCVAIVILAAAGCGGDFAPNPGADGSMGPFCALDIGLSAENLVGEAVVATAVESGSATGLRSLDWTVTRADQSPVPFSILDVDGGSISFAMPFPGIYEVRVSGTIGSTDCTPGVVTRTAQAENAVLRNYNLVVLPPADGHLVSRARIIAVAGGGDSDTGDLQLEAAQAVTGQLRDGNGQGVEGFIRIESLFDGMRSEYFADATGGFTAYIGPGNHVITVLPRAPGLAPLFAESAQASFLAGAVVLPSASLIQGTVTDEDGLPIAGARLTVRSANQPPSVGLTDASGNFEVRGNFASTVRLDLDSGDARFAALVDQSVTVGNGNWNVTLAERPTRALAATVRDANDQLVGERHMIVQSGDIAQAASIDSGGGPVPLVGRHTLTLRSDAVGAIAGTLFTAAYQVLVSGAPAQRGAIAAGAVAPASIALEAPAEVEVTVASNTGLALAGVLVMAIPDAVLLRAQAGITSGVTNAEGKVVLPVTPGFAVTVQVEATTSWLGRSVTGPALVTGTRELLPAVVLEPALQIFGRISSPSGPVGRAIVGLYCETCSPTSDAPLSRAMTDVAGNFVLLAPDPGLAE